MIQRVFLPSGSSAGVGGVSVAKNKSFVKSLMDIEKYFFGGVLHRTSRVFKSL